MTSTPVAPNNKPVSFSTKPVAEPSAAKPVKPRIRKAAKRAMKRGMISASAAKKHFGDY